MSSSFRALEVHVIGCSGLPFKELRDDDDDDYPDDDKHDDGDENIDDDEGGKLIFVQGWNLSVALFASCGDSISGGGGGGGGGCGPTLATFMGPNRRAVVTAANTQVAALTETVRSLGSKHRLVAYSLPQLSKPFPTIEATLCLPWPRENLATSLVVDHMPQPPSLVAAVVITRPEAAVESGSAIAIASIPIHVISLALTHCLRSMWLRFGGASVSFVKMTASV
jgi:hypothetical protein